MAIPPEQEAMLAVLRAHEARCEACRTLYEYAETCGDTLLLDAWRQQIAEHLDNERQAREP